MNPSAFAETNEFDIVPHARPRFPGHLQPNIPLEDAARGFGVNVSEALPEVMAKKIEAATSHGAATAPRRKAIPAASRAAPLGLPAPSNHSLWQL